MQERELVKRVLAGDPAAQKEFYDAHVDRIFRLAYRMTGDEESARECTQMSFIRIFDKLGTFRGDARLSTWVHTVSVSVILRWRKKVRKLEARHSDIEDAHDIGVEESGLESIVNDAIRKAIDALAAGYRAVVIMHDIEGYTHEEIGAALGIATGTSKVRLSRARQKLKEALADYAGDMA